MRSHDTRQDGYKAAPEDPPACKLQCSEIHPARLDCIIERRICKEKRGRERELAISALASTLRRQWKERVFQRTVLENVSFSPSKKTVRVLWRKQETVLKKFTFILRTPATSNLTPIFSSFSVLPLEQQT